MGVLARTEPGYPLCRRENLGMESIYWPSCIFCLGSSAVRIHPLGLACWVSAGPSQERATTRCFSSPWKVSRQLAELCGRLCAVTGSWGYQGLFGVQGSCSWGGLTILLPLHALIASARPARRGQHTSARWCVCAGIWLGRGWNRCCGTRAVPSPPLHKPLPWEKLSTGSGYPLQLNAAHLVCTFSLFSSGKVQLDSSLHVLSYGDDFGGRRLVATPFQPGRAFPRTPPPPAGNCSG